MSRSGPFPSTDDRAPDSSRDSFFVRDELPLELPILDDELLWLSDLVAALLAYPLDEEPTDD